MKLMKDKEALTELKPPTTPYPKAYIAKLSSGFV